MRIFPRFFRIRIKTQARRVRQMRRRLSVERALLALEVLLLVLVLVFSFTGRRAAYLNQLGSSADVIALGLLLAAFAALHLLIKRYLEPAIVRRFSPPAYDERRILLDLSHTARAATNVDQLYRMVVQMIGDALRTENVSIFVRDDATGDFVCRMTTGQDAPAECAEAFGGAYHNSEQQLVLKRDAFVVKRLRHLTAPWDIGAEELDTWMRALDGAPAPEQQRRAKECSTLRAVSSCLLLQIKMKNQLIGILSLGPRGSHHPFSVRDKELLTSVAGQLALIIENSKLVERMVEEERMRRELELAAEVQQRLFPSQAPLSSSLELYGFCQAARKVGGDYYDFIRFENNQIGVAVADVAGKGISAALLMSTVQASLRSQAMMGRADTQDDGSVANLVSVINRLMCKSTGEASYVTFFYAQFDEVTKNLTYVNAGHNPPLLIQSKSPEMPALSGHEANSLARVRVDEAAGVELKMMGEIMPLGADEPLKQCVKLTKGGPVIGVFENWTYEQDMIQLKSGDLLVAYTDGVTEAHNLRGEEFGEQRLQDIVTSVADLPAGYIHDHIVERIADWCAGAPQHDDLTFVIFKVK